MLKLHFLSFQCKLIIAQMSSTKCELLNNLLVPLVTIVTTVVFLDLGVLEFYLLCGYATFVTVSHVHFGICVVSIIFIHPVHIICISVLCCVSSWA